MDDLQQAIGRRVRKLRSKRGWTQEAFAAHCGIHRAHMGEIERGERRITTGTLQKLSKGIGVSLSMLFRGIEKDLPERG
jgi:transcriptional regulator with XRE-family HTH domain